MPHISAASTQKETLSDESLDNLLGEAAEAMDNAEIGALILEEAKRRLAQDESPVPPPSPG